MHRGLGALTAPLLAALIMLGGTATASAATPTTVDVTPSAMNGWQCIDDNTNLTAPCTLTNGPAPLSGSIEFTTPTGNERPAIATAAYAGTALSDITDLDYFTSQPGPTEAIALQFDIKYNSGDHGYGGRLVYEPYQNGHVTVGSGWHRWNALNGIWWSSKTSASPGSNGLCPQSAPCNWAQVLTNWPMASISGNVLLRAGGGAPWAGFVGYADALTVGVSGTDTTYDFGVPAPAVTTTTTATSDSTTTTTATATSDSTATTTKTLSEPSAVTTATTTTATVTAQGGVLAAKTCTLGHIAVARQAITVKRRHAKRLRVTVSSHSITEIAYRIDGRWFKTLHHANAKNGHFVYTVSLKGRRGAHQLKMTIHTTCGKPIVRSVRY